MKVGRGRKVFDWMNHILKTKYFSRLTTRIILLISTGLSVIIVLEAVMIYAQSSAIIQEEATNTLGQMLRLNSAGFEETLEQFAKYSLSLRNDERFMRIVGHRSELNYDDEQYLQSQIKSMFYSYADIFELEVFLENAQKSYLLSRDNHNLRTQDFAPDPEAEWYRQAAENSNHLYITPGADNAAKGNRFLTLYRALINVADRRPLAFVKISMKYQTFQRFLEIERVSQFDLYNAQGVLFSRCVPESVAPQILPLFDVAHNQKEDWTEIYRQDDTRYLVIHDVAPQGAWVFALSMPLDVLNERVHHARNISMLIGLCAVMLSIGIIMFFTRLEISSMEDLIRQINTMGKGHFKTRVQAKGHYEIVNLANSINAMLIRIDELVEQNYMAEINEKSARLTAFEAQLNPHFINNALQAVSYKAIQAGNRDVSRMVQSLAQNLRYTIKEDVLVPLSKEITHVENYMLLQQARFENGLNFQTHVQEEALSKYLPKLSLLIPMENALLHGMTSSAQALTVTVDAYLRGHTLFVEVRDDGAGMTPDELSLVRARMYDETWFFTSQKHIGLSNLNSRLKILYGQQAGITIESEQGKGTCVTLWLTCEENET